MPSFKSHRQVTYSNSAFGDERRLDALETYSAVDKTSTGKGGFVSEISLAYSMKLFKGSRDRGIR